LLALGRKIYLNPEFQATLKHRAEAGQVDWRAPRCSPGAEGGGAILDEAATRAVHHVISVVIGSGDDFFRHAEDSADFSAGEFAVLEGLNIGA
jgi:hypothetical protein